MKSTSRLFFATTFFFQLAMLINQIDWNLIPITQSNDTCTNRLRSFKLMPMTSFDNILNLELKHNMHLFVLIFNEEYCEFKTSNHWKFS